MLIKRIPFGDTTIEVELPERTFVIETEARRKLEPIGDLLCLGYEASRERLAAGLEIVADLCSGRQGVGAVVL